MGKIKLLRPLWNNKAGAIINVNKEFELFALRKGYAEPVPETIEPIKPQFAPENKAVKAPKKNK